MAPRGMRVITTGDHGIQGGRFAHEKIGISHLCARTPVFLHTFGYPPETFENQYKSTLAVFPLNWAYKNGTNKVNYEPCSLRMGPVHNLHVFGILWGVCPPIDSLIYEVDLWVTYVHR